MSQEDELLHQQPQNFDGRSTAGLEAVIMGCTSRRSKRGVSIHTHISTMALKIDGSIFIFFLYITGVIYLFHNIVYARRHHIYAHAHALTNAYE